MLGREEGLVKLSNSVLAELYDYATILAKSKFKNGVEILKTRHVGYELEDFVQEIIILVTKSFETKTFENMTKLKAFTVSTMKYHYLHEKRKYFYTKQRGDIQCFSLYEPACKVGEDYKLIIDTITYDSNATAEDICTYNNLISKNLQIVIDWPKLTVCRPDELRYHKGTVLSVNYFIKCQRELGMNDTCKLYKNNDFYMTKSFYKELSKLIIDYAKANDLLIVSDDLFKEERTTRKVVDRVEQGFMNLTRKLKTCTCGHYNEDASMYDSAWQCTKCGRINNRDDLLQLNSNVHSEVPRGSSLITLHKV